MTDYVTKAGLARFADALGKSVRSLFDREHGRFKALEDRVAELEADARNKEYRGVHDPGITYERGNSVTHHGSIWIAKKATTAVPGTSTDWQLAVKAGRNGKDAPR